MKRLLIGALLTGAMVGSSSAQTLDWTSPTLTNVLNGYKIVAGPSGSCYAIGWTPIMPFNSLAWRLTKLNSTGAIVFGPTLFSSTSPTALAGAVADLAVSGTDGSAYMVWTNTDMTVKTEVVTKFTSAGALAWQTSFTIPSSQVVSNPKIGLGTGDDVLVGDLSAVTSGSTTYSYRLTKLNHTTGAVAFSGSWPATGTDTLTLSGMYVSPTSATDQVYFNGTEVTSVGSVSTMRSVRFTSGVPDLAVLTPPVLGTGVPMTYGTTITGDPTAGAFVVGVHPGVDGYSSQSDNYIVACLPWTGSATTWVKEYNGNTYAGPMGPENPVDDSSCADFASDANGSFLYVGGRSERGTSLYDVFFVKVNPANGTELNRADVANILVTSVLPICAACSITANGVFTAYSGWIQQLMPMGPGINYGPSGFAAASICKGTTALGSNGQIFVLWSPTGGHSITLVRRFH